MSGVGLSIAARNLALAGAVLLGPGAAFADDNQGTPMTAGVVMDKMPVRERFSYIAGIVEGMAYSRFQKDTKASGSKDTAGMKCIYDWFYADNTKRMDVIEAAFRKYAEHSPATLMAVMVKKECGE